MLVMIFSAVHSAMRSRLRSVFIAFAGLGFVLVAMAAIQYQEVIAPGVERITAMAGNAQGPKPLV
jgi:hypothetical protein